MTKDVCPKCGAESGDDWRQCGGDCPMPMSPHFSPGLEAEKTRHKRENEFYRNALDGLKNAGTNRGTFPTEDVEKP